VAFGRWWRRALVLVVALTGGLALLSWAVVRSYGPELTRERIERALEDATGRPVRVGGARLEPWLGRLVLTDLAIAAGPSFRDGTLLTASRGEVSFRLESLWRRVATLSVAVTDLDLRLDLSRPAAAGPAFAFAVPDTVTIGPVTARIGVLRLARARALVEGAGTAGEIEALGVAASGWPRDGRLDVALRADSLRVGGTAVREVDLEARLSAERAAIGRLALRWEGAVLRAHGAVEQPWVEPDLALTVRGDVPLAPLARLAGRDEAVRGVARIEVELRGALAAPRVAGRASVAELAVDHVAARQVSIRGEWSDGALALDEIRGEILGGRLEASVTVPAATPRAARVAARLSGATLPAGLARLGQVAASAEGRVTGTGIELERARVEWSDAGLELDGWSGWIEHRGPIALAGRAAGDLGRLGRALGWDAAAGRVAVSVQVSGRRDAPALAGWIALDGVTVSGAPVAPAEARFDLAITLPGAATATAGRLAGTIRSPRVALAQAGIEDLDATIALDPERVEVLAARARLGTVPVEVAGALAWTGSGQARVRLGPAALSAVPGVPPALGLAGTAEVQGELTLRGGNVTTAGTARLGGVQLAGLALGAGTAAFRSTGTAVAAELAFPDRRLDADLEGRLDRSRALTARVRVADAGLRELVQRIDPAAAERVDGRVSARAEILLPLDRPQDARGVARLEAAGLRLLGEPWDHRGPVVMRWEDGRLHLDRLRLGGPAGTLTATGVLWGGDAPAALALALEEARLPGALAALGPGTARADVRLPGGGVEVARLTGTWPGVQAEAHGRAGSDATIRAGGRLVVDLRRVAHAAGGLPVPGPLSGEVTMTLDARGRWDAPALQGELRSPALGVAGVTLSDVVVPFRAGDGTLRVDGAALALGGSRISVAGGAGWPPATPLSALARQARLAVDVRAPALRMADLEAWLPPALRGTGQLALAARVEGPPGSWRAVGTLASGELGLPGIPLRELQASFAVDAGQIVVSALTTRVGGVPLRGSGLWTWAGGGHARAEVGPVELAEVPGVPAGLSLGGSGRGAVEVTMRSAADVAVSGRAVLDDVVLGGIGLGRGTVAVSGRGEAMKAELAFPGRRLDAAVEGPLRARSVLQVRAALGEQALAPLVGQLGLPAAASRLQGVVAARVSGRLPLDDPSRATGTLAIETSHLALAGEPWESRGPMVVSYRDEIVRLERFDLRGPAGAAVTGAGTLGADGTLDVRLDGRVSLATLAATRPEVREAAGTVDVTVSARGPLAAPALGGEVRVRDATLALRNRPEALRQLAARVTAGPAGVRLEQASAAFAGGRFEATGDLALVGWRPGAYRLGLVARGVGPALLDGLAAVWDADLELAGAGSSAYLRGEARLVRGTYTRDLSLLSLAVGTKPEAAAEPAVALPLQVRVRLDNPLVVRNRVAQLGVRGALSVEGTTSDPVLFGLLEARDGHVVFRGHRFAVTTASARFANPRRIEPLIEFVGTARIRTYDVTAELRGRPADLAVRLQSNPPLGQDDLLALVTFGVTRDEFRQSAGGILAGEVGKLFVQELLGVEGDMGGMVGLDVLELQSSGKDAGQAVRVGKQLTESALVVYSRNVSDGREQKLRIEYQLGGPVLLSGEHDFRGSYGADLILRLRFR
jgi:autotransporter translocation and assembly factor TamB